MFEPRDIFLEFLEAHTGEDEADLGPWLAQLFEGLDTPENDRPETLDEDLARFPYVNDDLFKGHLRTFSFDAAERVNTCKVANAKCVARTSLRPPLFLGARLDEMYHLNDVVGLDGDHRSLRSKDGRPRQE